jgi:hypothetical protein
MEYNETLGPAVDLNPRNRPGVPMEKAAEPLPGSREPIEPQHSDVKVLKDPHRPVTPVFGTAQPPTGLSGLLRRFAYGYSDNYARRWVVLLLADRVDALEHSVRRSLRASAGLAAVVICGGLTVMLLRR